MVAAPFDAERRQIFEHGALPLVDQLLIDDEWFDRWLRILDDSDCLLRLNLFDVFCNWHFKLLFFFDLIIYRQNVNLLLLLDVINNHLLLDELRRHSLLLFGRIFYLDVNIRRRLGRLLFRQLVCDV